VSKSTQPKSVQTTNQKKPTPTPNKPECKADQKSVNLKTEKLKPVGSPIPETNKTPETSSVTKQPEPSEKKFKEAASSLVNDSLPSQILLYSARVYSALKQIDKAKDFYQKLIKMKPKVCGGSILCATPTSFTLGK
jgi:hypothetical protein